MLWNHFSPYNFLVSSLAVSKNNRSLNKKEQKGRFVFLDYDDCFYILGVSCFKNFFACLLV